MAHMLYLHKHSNNRAWVIQLISGLTHEHQHTVTRRQKHQRNKQHANCSAEWLIAKPEFFSVLMKLPCHEQCWNLSSSLSVHYWVSAIPFSAYWNFSKMWFCSFAILHVNAVVFWWMVSSWFILTISWLTSHHVTKLIFDHQTHFWSSSNCLLSLLNWLLAGPNWSIAEKSYWANDHLRLANDLLRPVNGQFKLDNGLLRPVNDQFKPAYEHVDQLMVS